MNDEFIIKPSKPTSSTVISTRLPDSLIEQLDDVSKKTDRSRNELIVMCVEYALQRLKIEEQDETAQK